MMLRWVEGASVGICRKSKKFVGIGGRQIDWNVVESVLLTRRVQEYNSRTRIIAHKESRRKRDKSKRLELAPRIL
jgi:hypothetical protein